MVIELTEQEAYRILGLRNGADAELIRKKYRELIVQVHPDTRRQQNEAEAGCGNACHLRDHNAVTAASGDSEISSGRHRPGRGPLYDARKINQAYNVLQRLHSKSMISQEVAPVKNRDSRQQAMNPDGTSRGRGSGTESDSFGKWSAPCNPHAYMAREVYCRAEDVDGTPIGVFPIAKGKYLWTLDEDFPLFMRSIYLCAGKLLSRADADASSARSLAGGNADSSSGRIARRRGASNSRSRREQALISLTFLLAQQFIDAQAMLRALAVKVEAGGEGAGGKTNGSASGGAGETCRRRHVSADCAKETEAGHGGCAEAPASDADTETWSLPAMLELSGISSPSEKGMPAEGSRSSSSRRSVLPAEGDYLFPAGIRDHRLYLKNAAGQELGYLSFRDDRMYYILIPLFEQRRVRVRIRVTGAPMSKGRRPRRTKTSSASGSSFLSASSASTAASAASASSAWQDLELQIRFNPMQGNLFPESINAQIEDVLREYRSG